MSAQAETKRRPFQVYLTAKEMDLLNLAARTSGQTKSDVVREAVRRLERELIPAEEDPAWRIIGLAGANNDIPTDFAARHDDYLVEWERDANRPREAE